MSGGGCIVYFPSSVTSVPAEPGWVGILFCPLCHQLWKPICKMETMDQLACLTQLM